MSGHDKLKWTSRAYVPSCRDPAHSPSLSTHPAGPLTQELSLLPGALGSIPHCPWPQYLPCPPLPLPTPASGESRNSVLHEGTHWKSACNQLLPRQMALTRFNKDPRACLPLNP